MTEELQRYRRAVGQLETTAQDVLAAFGGDVPDWLRGEVTALAGALASLERARAAVVAAANA